MGEIIILWIILILFVYKLLLKPILKFANTITNTNEITNGGQHIKEIHDIGHDIAITSTLQNYPGGGVSNRFARCTSDGLYLGPRDVPVDCSSLCGSSLYKYRFIHSDDALIVNHAFVSKSGGYCLPDNVPECNTYTSRLIKTIDNWKCLPKGNLFGGDDGCQIIGCNGFVKDNLTGVYYNGRIPPTLAMSDPDSETVPHQLVYGVPGPNLYRFQCTDTEVDVKSGEPTAMAKKHTVKDFMNNKLIASEFSRFDRVRNTCASLIYNASHVIEPNFQRGTCTCLAKLHLPDNKNSNLSNNIRRFIDNVEIVDIPEKCSPCPSGWSDAENLTNVGVPCRKAYDDTYDGADRVLIPCGVRNFDGRTAACLNVKIYTSKGLSSFARKVFAK